MTAQELAAMRDSKPETIPTPRTSYTTVVDDHDQWGNDLNDHHVFDSRRTEDVFPY